MAPGPARSAFGLPQRREGSDMGDVSGREASCRQVSCGLGLPSAFLLGGMSFLAAQKSTRDGPGAKVGFGPRISAFSFRSIPSGTKARHLRQPGKDQGFGPETARPWNGPPKRAKP